MLRVAVVGAGRMGQNHIRVLRGLDGVTLVAIVDPRAAEFAPDSTVNLVTEISQLEDLELDYAVIATPTEFHEAVATWLIERGIHVLIEKPLAADSEAAARIERSASSHGVIAGVGHIERFNAALREARRRIASGELGTVHQVATERLSQRPARITDVGVALDLMTHDVDLTAWLCSSPYVTISAQVRSLPGSTSEDLVVACGALADGTVVSHLVNWVSPFKKRAVVVTGEKGALVIDTLREDVALHGHAVSGAVWDGLANLQGQGAGDVTHFAFPRPEPLVVEHEAFRDAVLGQGGEIVTLTEGAATIRVVEEVLRGDS